MPYIRGHRRRKARAIARAKRRALYRKQRYRRRRIPVGMPSKKLVKLKYVDNITIDPIAGSPQGYYFSANGMYDPNVTGVGHQPLYFDQYMANYDHYQVIGSAIRVTQMPTSGGEKAPAVWGVILDDNNVLSYSTVEQAIEANQSKGKFLMGSQGAATSFGTSGKHPRMIRKFSAKKFLGDLSDKHEGSALANPTDQAYFGIWAGSPSNVTDPSPLQFMVEISYIAILKEPKFIAQS